MSVSLYAVSNAHNLAEQFLYMQSMHTMGIYNMHRILYWYNIYSYIIILIVIDPIIVFIFKLYALTLSIAIAIIF